MPSKSYTRALTQPAPDSITPIPIPVNTLPPVPDPSAPFGYSANQLSPVPPALSTAPDQLQNWRRPVVSQTRIFSLPAAAATSQGAAARSQAIDVVAPVAQQTTNNTTAAVDIQINGVAITGTVANFNPSTPAIPGGNALVTFQADAVTPDTGISAYVAPFVASGASHAPGVVPDPGSSAGITRFLREDATFDVPPVFGASGSSHAVGYVPDPGASAGSTRYLREDGTFQVPPGTGGAAFYQTVQAAGVSKPQETKLNFLSPFIVADNSGNTSTDISLGVVDAVQLFDITTLTGGAVSSASPTSLGSLSITLPATGGPFRVDIRYSFYLRFTAGLEEVDFWVQSSTADSTGQTVWAGTWSGPSNATSGGRTCVSCAMMTDGTYAAGATPTFILYGYASAAGAVVNAAQGFGAGPNSTFQVSAFPSV